MKYEIEPDTAYAVRHALCGSLRALKDQIIEHMAKLELPALATPYPQSVRELIAANLAADVHKHDGMVAEFAKLPLPMRPWDGLLTPINLDVLRAELIAKAAGE